MTVTASITTSVAVRHIHRLSRHAPTPTSAFPYSETSQDNGVASIASSASGTMSAKVCSRS